MELQSAIRYAKKYARRLNAPVVVYSFKDKPDDFNYFSAHFFRANFSNRWQYEDRKIYLIEVNGEVKPI